MLTRENGRYSDQEFTLANHVYKGRSVGSEETCHQFPGYGFCFDIGAAPLSSTTVPTVFITHGHEDHCGGLVRHFVRRKGWGLDPSTYYIPTGDLALVKAMVQAHRALSRSRGDITLTPFEAGMEVPVGGNLVVRAFTAHHRIPCQGYSVWSTRKRLKAEFQGLPGQEIARLKREGTQVDAPVEVCEIAFPGDTSMRVLETEPAVGAARALLLECTFLNGDVSAKDAQRTGHVHIDDLVAAAKAGAFRKTEVILLTHFSARYHPNEVRDIVEKRLRDTEIWQKVQLLLPKPRV